MVNALDLLKDARANHYAIAALNAVNLETAQAIVQAATLENTPVILQISENAARYAGLHPLFALAQELKREARCPVILHFDHAETLDSALAALRLGFDSVMLEGADLGLKENARQLRLLSDAAHHCGAMVEGEFEIVSKDGREGKYLSARELETLATLADCDSIAVDIGSKHKMTQKEAALDLSRLETIADHLKHPLVLHGSSGIPEKDLVDAVKLGISKVNIATDLMLEFTKGVRMQLRNEEIFDPRKYLTAGRRVMTERARHYIQLLGRK